MTETPVLPGRIVRVDLMTTDLDAARKLYLTLFPSWKEGAAPPALAAGTGAEITLDGRGVGSMVALDAAGGLPSHWIPYVTVADVDETCARATELGGKVTAPPQDVRALGRVAVVEDRQGAPFSPIAMLEEPPERTGPMPEGAWCWHELMTTDAADAVAFYTALLGWSHAEVPVGDAPYHLFRRGEMDAAGALQRPAGLTDRPGWRPFIYTGDVEATLAKAVELGAAIVIRARKIPGVGQLAGAASPAGATFTLFRSERG